MNSRWPQVIPPSLPWVGQLSTLVVGESNKRLEEMGSDDRIEWTEAYGGSLYGFKDTLEAVGDGLTDAGWGRNPLGRQQNAFAERHLFHAIRIG